MNHRHRLAPRHTWPHVCCALLLLAACAAAGSGAPGGSVLSIRGAEEFSQALADHPLLVVAFVAPWCGHCKRLEPVLNEVAAGYASAKAAIAFAQLDATDKANNEELRVRYNVQGFPTLKVFRGGVPEALDYRGPRDVEGIRRYLERLLRPPAVELRSREEALAHLRNSTAGGGDITVVHAFLPGGNASAAFPAFQAVADALREDVDWGFAADHELLEHCSGHDCRSPFLALHKGGGREAKGGDGGKEDKVWRYEGEFEPGLLRSWVESHSTPLLVTYSPEDREGMRQYRRVLEASLPKFYMITKKESAALREQLAEAARANDDLKFVLVPAGQGRRVMDRLGVRRGELPAFAIQDTERKEVYVKPEARESELAEWIYEFKQGALTPRIKVEPAAAASSASGRAGGEPAGSEGGAAASHAEF